MKYSTLSRITYLRKARHRGGHGIHSPFLFHLITAVIENKQQFSEYKILKRLHTKALNLLNPIPDLPFTKNRNDSPLSVSKPRKFYEKMELPRRYLEMIFRLIREFKPSALIHYGPTLGVNSGVMALANYSTPVYQSTNHPSCDLFTQKLLQDSAIHNFCFLPDSSTPPVHPEFILISYPDDPERTRIILQKCLNGSGENDLILIKGIHQSKEMETIWQELISQIRVRVTLDLFEIGIALFRPGLQKEDFILRF